MSDQANPPPKPKPGSLRDRIAAFEKGGAGGPAPAPAPARPKPAGFSTWKPKQPSPPSSPPASDNALSSTAKPPLAAGMSASDAKDSIVKGGSLKDRMAALQGKGAFGAPPPLAPKPATEKPKWKPPPVVSAPVDDDDDPTNNVVAPRLPPPAAASESGDIQKAEVDIDKEAVEKSQATGSEDVDQEEERQRRAAIAARMARLGGARLGMTPIFGKKPPPPPAKKPTLSVKDELPNEPTSPPPQTLSAEPQAETGVAASTGSATVASQREEVTPNLQTTFPEDKISPVAPSSSAESSEAHATRSPPSMPVPAMPRRAAPPRSKKSRPTAQVPETLAEVPAIPVEIPAISAAEASIPESASVKIDESSAAASAQTQSVDQVEDPIKPEAHDTKDKSEEPIAAKEEEPEAVLSPSPVQDEVYRAIVKPSSPASDPIVLVKEADKEGKPLDEGEMPSSGQALSHSNETSEKEANVEVEVVEYEESRCKKVAERLAKMGGVNPFAPPSLPRRQSSISSDTTASPHHSSLAVEQKVEKAAIRSPSPKPIIKTIPEETSSSPTSSPSAGVAKPEAATAPVSAEVETKPLLEPKAPELLGESDDESGYEDSGSEGDEPLKYDPRNIQGVEAVDDPSDHISSIPIPPPRAPRQDSLPTRSPTAKDAGDANSEERGTSEEENEDLSRARILEPAPGAIQVGAADEDDEQTPLPVPNRTHQTKSFHLTETTSEAFSSFAPRRGNSPPPPPPTADESNDNTDSDSEYDSDEDEPLPVRPLSSDQHDESDRALGSGAPLIVPPPTSSPRPAALHQPPPRALPPTPHFPVHDTSGAGPSTSHSSLTVPAPAEVLDDEEGDPIDPSFHTPSRRASTILPSVPSVTFPSETELASSLAQGLHPTSSPPEQAPFESKAEARDEEAEAEAARRRTIAERMAKLGGIKFGAAPPVPAGRFKRQSVSEEAKVETVESQGGQEDKFNLTEEEEETARKERISAKLAGMGGMRIGMLPTAVPQRNPAAAATREPEPAPKSPPPPSRGPSSRPPPPPQAPDSESEQDSVAASDDIVNIEAEESEIEEVSYEEAPIEIGPPIPSRGARLVHRTSLDHPNTPPRPVTRPPVPVVRKFSGQTEATQRRTSGDLGLVPPKIPVARGQSDYVMVEEPETEEPPPPPPSRPSTHGPPSRPPPPPAVDTLSSQWELPSIPTSSLDLGGDDLSMSWTEAEVDAPIPLGESVTLVPSPNQTPQLANAGGISKPATGSNDVPLSADDLMAVWGRVGVQVCEVATTLFERSKKGLIGDGTYSGFVHAVLNEVPNASQVNWGYLVYKQTGASVQKRASDIMPGDLVEFSDAKFKGHKGLHAYHATFGIDEPLIGVVNEYEPKKSKIRVFQANQSVGQQTVESVSYRLDDLKSGNMKIFRVLEA